MPRHRSLTLKKFVEAIAPDLMERYFKEKLPNIELPKHIIMNIEAVESFFEDPRNAEAKGLVLQDFRIINDICEKGKSTLVLVDGLEIRLGDKLFALLMALVLKLKKGKGGWVHISVLKDAGGINDIEHRQPISNLRTALKGSLIKKDGQKFIESDGSRNYRLSTHPDFVTYDKKKLKTHPDPQIQQQLIKSI